MKKCKWTPLGRGVWKTECGTTCIDGGYIFELNWFKFCPFCSKPLEENPMMEYLTGKVCPLGYVIIHITNNFGVECYRAMSNHPYYAAAPISALQEWCDKTGEEMANQMKIKYVGNTLVDNRELNA